MANGLGAKVLGLIPRHQEIVARILGPSFAEPLTLLIGLSEIAMGLWILKEKHKKVTAAIQIGIVLTMNLLETFLARDLLLWGPWNLLFALLFCGVVFYHGFVLKASDHVTP
ncbi:MAG: DoxX-like family protein [Bacteroidota bacterium]